jgi:two-component system, chemotaxis family, chemotaxis protein CheY
MKRFVLSLVAAATIVFAAATSPASAQPINPASMTILVMDDYATMRRILRSLLTQIGFRDILEAGQGEGALGFMRDQRIDLVVADRNNDMMGAIAMVRVMRADPQLKAIPVVMVIQYSDATPENIKEATDAGINNVIVKPFNAASLKSAIVTVLGEF